MTAPKQDLNTAPAARPRCLRTTVVSIASIALAAVGFAMTSPAASAASADVTWTNGTQDVSDGFSRTVSSGLGPAITGGTWNVKPAGLFTVGKGFGAVGPIAGGKQAIAVLAGLSSLDQKAQMTFKVSALPTTSSGFFVYLSTRVQGDGAAITARLKVNPGGAAQLDLADIQPTAVTALSQRVTLPFKIVAGQLYTVQVLSTGTTPTGISAKAWRFSDAPPGWQVSSTAGTNAVTKAGSVGFIGLNNDTRTPITLSVDAMYGWKMVGTPVVPPNAAPRTAFTSTAQNYAAGGRYPLTLVVTDDDGDWGISSLQYDGVANVAPSAAIDVGVDKLAAAFDAAASVDTDGSIARYEWDFGDGSTGSGVTAKHTYRTAGAYTATLAVTDDDGASATTSVPVVVRANVAPTASFGSTVDGRSAAFDAGASSDADGKIGAYSWDFGDGSTGNGVTAAHTYSSDGTYTASLTVTDDDGATSTSAASVQAAAKVAPVLSPAADGPSFPDATNTGVPAGTNLKVVTGQQIIKTAGTVIDGWDVHGQILVRAPNVTIRNSIIRGAAFTSTQCLISANTATATNLQVLDSEIVPEFPSVYAGAGICGSNFTATRLNIHGSVDGVMVYHGNVTVRDSYIHGEAFYDWDPFQTSGSHNDGIQVQGGDSIHIVGNRIEGGNNAAIQVKQDIEWVTNLVIEKNFLDYGTRPVKISPKKLYTTMSLVKVNNNVIGTHQTTKDYAVIAEYDTKLEAVGNTWVATGKPAPGIVF